ncbi:MAG: Crp/Fnr family transcriptional regulator [Syntrophobacteraceae bacterium]
MDSSMEQSPVCSEYRNDIDLLRQVPILSVMPLEAIKVLACLCTREKFLAGDIVFSQDEVDEHAYHLLEGEAELLLQTEGGEERIRIYRQSDFIGGFSLIAPDKRLFSLRAKTDLCCLMLSHHMFQKTLKQFPDTAWDILKELTRAINQWEYRLLHGKTKLCEKCKSGVGVTLL